MRRTIWKAMSRRVRRKHNCDYRTSGVCRFFRGPSVAIFHLTVSRSVCTRVACAAAAVKGLRRAAMNYAPDRGRYAPDGHPRFDLWRDVKRWQRQLDFFASSIPEAEIFSLRSRFRVERNKVGDKAIKIQTREGRQDRTRFQPLSIL